VTLLLHTPTLLFANLKDYSNDLVVGYTAEPLRASRRGGKQACLNIYGSHNYVCEHEVDPKWHSTLQATSIT